MSSKATVTVSVGVNISSAAQFASYACVATGAHRFQVFLDNAAGNGDYVLYLKRQRLGAGTAYPVLGKTTIAAASGETAFCSPTISLDCDATDVIGFWADGLAGDAAVTGSVQIWVEDTSAVLAAAIWAYVTRTLTQSALSVTSTVSGSTLTITRGDTLAAAFTGLSSNTGYTSLWFTVKRDPSDADSAAIIQIKKNASGLTDGLLYLNGAAGTAGLGSITVVSGTALTINLDETASDDLAAEDALYYDIQMLVSGAVTTIQSGTCNIVADVTKAVA